MWFRIELHKDGSVASCVEVEGSFKDTRTVHYVEADSKEQAIKRVLINRDTAMRSYARDYKKKLYAEKRSAGLCASNHCEFNATDGAYCPEHAETVRTRHREYQRRKRAGTGPIKRMLSPEEQVARQLRLKGQKAKSNKRFGSTHATVKRRLLVQVAAKFDSMTPRTFRAWLQSEIDAIEQRAAKAPASAAADHEAQPQGNAGKNSRGHDGPPGM